MTMPARLEAVDHFFFWLINRSLHHPALDDVFTGLSSLGGWTVGLLALVLLGTEGRRALARHILVMAVFLTMIAAINTRLKEFFDRPRPTAVFEHTPADEAGSLIRVLELNPPRRNSFPSGHSLTAFFMLVYAGRRRRSFLPWFLFLAGGIAWARVYVGVHFPLDCLAGSLIGALGAGLAAWTFERLEKLPCS